MTQQPSSTSPGRCSKGEIPGVRGGRFSLPTVVYTSLSHSYTQCTPSEIISSNGVVANMKYWKIHISIWMFISIWIIRTLHTFLMQWWNNHCHKWDENPRQRLCSYGMHKICSTWKVWYRSFFLHCSTHCMPMLYKNIYDSFSYYFSSLQILQFPSPYPLQLT